MKISSLKKQINQMKKSEEKSLDTAILLTPYILGTREVPAVVSKRGVDGNQKGRSSLQPAQESQIHFITSLILVK
jgi:hypothetical protein